MALTNERLTVEGSVVAAAIVRLAGRFGGDARHWLGRLAILRRTTTGGGQMPLAKGDKSAGKKAADTKAKKAIRRTAIARKAANTKAANTARRSAIAKRAARTRKTQRP